jgi:hypothetical protein
MFAAKATEPQRSVAKSSAGNSKTGTAKELPARFEVSNSEGDQKR